MVTAVVLIVRLVLKPFLDQGTGRNPEVQREGRLGNPKLAKLRFANYPSVEDRVQFAGRGEANTLLGTETSVRIYSLPPIHTRRKVHPLP